MPIRSSAAVAICFFALCTSQSARADEPKSDWPRVEIVAPRITGLPKLEMESTNGWQDVDCVFPCVTRLDPASAYRVSGDGVVDSDAFRLPQGANRVRLDVTTGSTMMRGVGIYLAVGGLLFMGGGTTLLFVPNSSTATEDQKTSKTVVGIAGISMGAIAAAVGILAYVLSDTSVKVSTASEAK